MSAVNLYTALSKLIIQRGHNENVSIIRELYHLMSPLYRILTCTICDELLTDAYTPIDTSCEHHVCGNCINENKKHVISCSYCADSTYIDNNKLQTLVDCFRELCFFAVSTNMYQLLLEYSDNDECDDNPIINKRNTYKIINIFNHVVGTELIGDGIIHDNICYAQPSSPSNEVICIDDEEDEDDEDDDEDDEDYVYNVDEDYDYEDDDEGLEAEEDEVLKGDASIALPNEICADENDSEGTIYIDDDDDEDYDEDYDDDYDDDDGSSDNDVNYDDSTIDVNADVIDTTHSAVTDTVYIDNQNNNEDNDSYPDVNTDVNYNALNATTDAMSIDDVNENNDNDLSIDVNTEVNENTLDDTEYVICIADENNTKHNDLSRDVNTEVNDSTLDATTDVIHIDDINDKNENDSSINVNTEVNENTLSATADVECIDDENHNDDKVISPDVNTALKDNIPSATLNDASIDNDDHIESTAVANDDVFSDADIAKDKLSCTNRVPNSENSVSKTNNKKSFSSKAPSIYSVSYAISDTKLMLRRHHPPEGKNRTKDVISKSPKGKRNHHVKKSANNDEFFFTKDLSNASIDQTTDDFKLIQEDNELSSDVSSDQNSFVTYDGIPEGVNHNYKSTDNERSTNNISLVEDDSESLSADSSTVNQNSLVTCNEIPERIDSNEKLIDTLTSTNDLSNSMTEVDNDESTDDFSLIQDDDYSLTVPCDKIPERNDHNEEFTNNHNLITIKDLCNANTEVDNDESSDNFSLKENYGELISVNSDIDQHASSNEIPKDLFEVMTEVDQLPNNLSLVQNKSVSLAACNEFSKIIDNEQLIENDNIISGVIPKFDADQSTDNLSQDANASNENYKIREGTNHNGNDNLIKDTVAEFGNDQLTDNLLLRQDDSESSTVNDSINENESSNQNYLNMCNATIDGNSRGEKSKNLSNATTDNLSLIQNDCESLSVDNSSNDSNKNLYDEKAEVDHAKNNLLLLKDLSVKMTKLDNDQSTINLLSMQVNSECSTVDRNDKYVSSDKYNFNDMLNDDGCSVKNRSTDTDSTFVIGTVIDNDVVTESNPEYDKLINNDTTNDKLDVQDSKTRTKRKYQKKMKDTSIACRDSYLLRTSIPKKYSTCKTRCSSKNISTIKYSLRNKAESSANEDNSSISKQSPTLYKYNLRDSNTLINNQFSMKDDVNSCKSKGYTLKDKQNGGSIKNLHANSTELSQKWETINNVDAINKNHSIYDNQFDHIKSVIESVISDSNITSERESNYTIVNQNVLNHNQSTTDYQLRTHKQSELTGQDEDSMDVGSADDSLSFKKNLSRKYLKIKTKWGTKQSSSVNYNLDITETVDKPEFGDINEISLTNSLHIDNFLSFDDEPPEKYIKVKNHSSSNQDSLNNSHNAMKMNEPDRIDSNITETMMDDPLSLKKDLPKKYRKIKENNMSSTRSLPLRYSLRIPNTGTKYSSPSPQRFPIKYSLRVPNTEPEDFLSYPPQRPPIKYSLRVPSTEPEDFLPSRRPALKYSLRVPNTEPEYFLSSPRRSSVKCSVRVPNTEPEYFFSSRKSSLRNSVHVSNIEPEHLLSSPQRNSGRYSLRVPNIESGTNQVNINKLTTANMIRVKNNPIKYHFHDGNVDTDNLQTVADLDSLQPTLDDPLFLKRDLLFACDSQNLNSNTDSTTLMNQSPSIKYSLRTNSEHSDTVLLKQSPAIGYSLRDTHLEQQGPSNCNTLLMMNQIHGNENIELPMLDNNQQSINISSNQLVYKTPTNFKNVTDNSSGKKWNRGKGNNKTGCRCGTATPNPGKLTCCGQRCPCYIDSKACSDCKCRGCRNPHMIDGVKVLGVYNISPSYETIIMNTSSVTSSLSSHIVPVNNSRTQHYINMSAVDFH